MRLNKVNNRLIPSKRFNSSDMYSIYHLPVENRLFTMICDAYEPVMRHSGGYNHFRSEWRNGTHIVNTETGVEFKGRNSTLAVPVAVTWAVYISVTQLVQQYLIYCRYRVY